MKKEWPTGPWTNEPDEETWIDEATGFPCHARRNPYSGAWCGYVSIRSDHPFFGVDYNEVEAPVHGGLTYSEFTKTPELWELGFDCAHYNDLCPGFLNTSHRGLTQGTYRTLEYVKSEGANLARQLKALEKKD